MPKLNFFDTFRQKYLKVLSTILMFLIFAVVLNKNVWSKTNIRGNLDLLKHTELSWNIKEEGSNLTLPCPRAIPMKGGTKYTMSTVLTYDGTKDEIPYGFLHESHMYVRGKLDGKELFTYMPDKVKNWDRGRSAGFVYIDFPLPHDCKGKLLEIDLYPVLRGTMTYNVQDIYFGNYKSVIHSMIKRDLPHNIITLLCMLLGVAALIYSAASLTGDDYREGFNIGCFALLISSYFMTECSTNNYFLSSPYYMYFINYFCFNLMPLSFMTVMRECMSGKQKRIATKVIIIETVIFFIVLFIHIVGIADWKELLPISHFIDFVTIFLISGFLITMKDKKRKLSLQLQLLPVTIGMILDFLIYWQHWDIGVNDATFSTLGILIFLFNELLSKMISQNRRITKMQQHTIEGMATLIESRDGSTGNHVRNTGVYAQMIASELYRRHMYPKEINPVFVDMIGRIAPLHDVGKIKISDTILNKPGSLTKEEYEIMKTHAELGGEIIKDILHEDLDSKMLRMAQNIATYHHERWDGKGYPKGLKETEIPLEARIMSVADVFDALASKRIYKEEMSIDDVFNEMINNEGKQFQSELVEVFVSLRSDIEEYMKNIKDTRTKAINAIAM